MPSHPDDGGPFFQLARTVIQQADFAIDQHPEEKERILGHYECVELLLTHFLTLQLSPDTDVLGIEEWIAVIHELRMRLCHKLEELEIYDYDIRISYDDDAVPIAFIPRFQ